ncbi:MAG: PAS domain-containing protein [Bryobacteraceae bacterium]|nr:PAS domain-containing protein [Bryobacteraceae bacterium]
MLDAFQKLCSALPEPTFLVTAQGEIAAANAAAGELVGSSVAALAGRTLSEFLLDPPEKIREFVRLAERTREFIPGAAVVRAGDGAGAECRLLGGFAGATEAGVGLIFLRITPRAESARQFRALNERIERLNAEIAERRRIEAQLHAHKEWLRTTLSSIGDGVLVTDLERRVTFMNPVAETLTGWTWDEAAGLPVETVFQVVEERSRGAIENPVHRALSQGMAATLPNHAILISRSGVERPIDDSASPIRDERGELIGAVLIFRDMTKWRRHERTLQLSHRHLQQVNDSLKQFAYAAAHDLKEPLRGVSIYSELLGRRYGGRLDEKANEFLAFIKGGARRMQALVDDLYRFTQAADTLNLPLETVDCNKVAKQALDNLTGLIGQSQAIITVDPLPAVSAHEMPLLQVFQNLIANAIQYRRRSQQPKVRISAERASSYWRFAVRDNGIGIPEDYHRVIFGVFKRLHPRAAGSGIGLAICERVVERYGGRVWVDSRVGSGSTFYFTLPETSGAEAVDAAAQS